MHVTAMSCVNRTSKYRPVCPLAPLRLFAFADCRTYPGKQRIHLFIFFYANHPLQGFRSHCSVKGYSSLLVATAGAEATTRTGRQHTHTHTHTHTLNPQLSPLLPPNMT